MTFQRIIAGLLALTIAGLAGAFYMNWKTETKLRTLKAFVESYVFAEAVAACEKATSSTPFNWNAATNASVVGLHSVKLDKKTIIASYTLVRGRRVLRLRSGQEESRYRIEFSRAGVVYPHGEAASRSDASRTMAAQSHPSRRGQEAAPQDEEPLGLPRCARQLCLKEREHVRVELAVEGCAVKTCRVDADAPRP